MWFLKLFACFDTQLFQSNVAGEAGNFCEKIDKWMHKEFD